MVTVKINERTKAGKALLNLIELFSKSQEGIQILDSKTDIKEKEPNEITLISMEKTRRGEDLTKTKDHEDLMNKLFS